MEGNESLKQRTFTARLMAELLKNGSNENLVISPMGISYVMRVLQSGVKQDCVCFKKIEGLIGQESFEESTEYDFERQVLKHALSCWHNTNFGHLKSEYIEEIKKLNGVSVFETDFETDKSVVQKMDKWTKENTNGMIGYSGLNVPTNTVTLFIDTLYMYAEWFRKFDKKLTKRETFYNTDGSKSEVDMMHRLLYLFDYSETDDFQTISLRYDNSFTKMKIVKPKKTTSLHELMTEKFDTWTQSEENWADVDFYMPRFKIESDFDLINTFKKLGLSEVFNDTNVLCNMADTQNMIDSIRQHCVIDVDEKGTKAASSIETCRKFGLPPKMKKYVMKLDKPFAFAIMGKNGVPLFVGVIDNLPNSDGIISKESK